MTYNVSSRAGFGPVLVGMGVVHLALSDWGRLASMARRGWWATADTPEAGQALWFAVAGGALVSMGSFAAPTRHEEPGAPRLAAVAFTATMTAAFTATTSPGAGVGVIVGLAMCASCRSHGHR